jgi:hypothetical protein
MMMSTTTSPPSSPQTAFSGWISIDESASGIMSVLARDEELNGRWFSYDGTEIPY